MLEAQQTQKYRNLLKNMVLKYLLMHNGATKKMATAHRLEPMKKGKIRLDNYCNPALIGLALHFF